MSNVNELNVENVNYDLHDKRIADDLSNQQNKLIGVNAQGTKLEFKSTSGLVETDETFTIATADWTALDNSNPFVYQATVTVVHTLGNDTEVSLAVDDVVLFANYGFVIGAITNQVITIYAVAVPASNVSLTVRMVD